MVAGLFFIPKKHTEPATFQMPDMVAIAGGLTENETWFGGGAYFGFWKKDHIRYRGILGYGDIKMKYYAGKNNTPVNFNNTSYFFYSN